MRKTIKHYTDCYDDYDIYFTGDFEESLPSLPETFLSHCPIVELHVIIWGWDPSKPIRNLTSPWTAQYSLGWQIFPACFDYCNVKGGLCLEDSNKSFQCGGLKNHNALPISVFAFLLAVMMILFQCSRTRYFSRTKNTQSFEDFLQSHPHLTPKRDSYSGIKRMTKSFKYKLGQGGNDGVFKGKLIDGRLVAVKKLTVSKGNGE